MIEYRRCEWDGRETPANKRFCDHYCKSAMLNWEKERRANLKDKK